MTVLKKLSLHFYLGIHITVHNSKIHQTLPIHGKYSNLFSRAMLSVVTLRKQSTITDCCFVESQGSKCKVRV